MGHFGLNGIRDILLLHQKGLCILRDLNQKIAQLEKFVHLIIHLKSNMEMKKIVNK